MEKTLHYTFHFPSWTYGARFNAVHYTNPDHGPLGMSLARTGEETPQPPQHEGGSVYDARVFHMNVSSRDAASAIRGLA